jgi:hypothetical protein
MRINQRWIFATLFLAASSYALAANPLVARGGERGGGGGEYRGGEQGQWGQHPEANGYMRGYNQGENNAGGGGGGGYGYPPDYYAPPPQQPEQQPMQAAPYNPV